MTRASHRPDKTLLRCRRCGLPSTRGGRCPPGYWMTDDEAKRWTEMSPTARERFERQLACAPPPNSGDPP